jgi:selT/selW/selH-like putative selenoprotein
VIPAEVRLIESSGGVFEVVVDGRLVYSKKKTGEFPGEARLVGEIHREWG